MAYYGTALMVGMVVGVGLLSVMYILMQRIEQVKFKTYLRERDDTTRECVEAMLEDILKTYDEIAQKTNTMVFKRRSNEMRTLIAFIKSYRTNN